MKRIQKITRREALRQMAIVGGSLAGYGLVGCGQTKEKTPIPNENSETNSLPSATPHSSEIKTEPTAQEIIPQGEPTSEEIFVEEETPQENPAPVKEVVFNVPPEDALVKLVEGNQRFVSGYVQHPRQEPERRTELVEGQSPFAVVLTCSDSRVPPEIIFDQGLGDIFVVRTAGNVADEVALGSLEYAVEHLGVSLILVMGHQKCGAVSAAVQGGEVAGFIKDIVEMIIPSVELAKKMPGDLITNTIDQNVKTGVERLANLQPILAHFVSSGQMEIVGGRYDLDSGKVEFISISPELEAAIAAIEPLAEATPQPPTPGDILEATTTPPPPQSTITGAPTSVPALAGIPSSTYPLINISAVTMDTSVTIQAYNFPPTQTFKVRMGEYGSLGIGGPVVAEVRSANRVMFEATFNIPASLKGRRRIAIRLESPEGYYSYSWFYNYH